MFLSIRNSILTTALTSTACLLLFSGAASAQSQTESFSVGAALQSLAPSGDFTLPDFDTSLGTLQSINITLTLNNSSTIQVYSNSSQPVNFTNASINMDGSVFGPAGTVLNATLTANIPSETAHLGLNTYQTDPNTIIVSSLIDSSLFGLWEDQADGKVDFSYAKGDPTFQGTAQGNGLFFGGELKGCGQVTIEYTYLSGSSGDPVATPEPSGKYLSALAAAGMLFLVFGRRKRLTL